MRLCVWHGNKLTVYGMIPHKVTKVSILCEAHIEIVTYSQLLIWHETLA